MKAKTKRTTLQGQHEHMGALMKVTGTTAVLMFARYYTLFSPSKNCFVPFAICMN